jgi:cyanophycin synthetase
MEIRRILALRGPNIWSRHPVLEAWVDLKDLSDRPSDSIPGLNDRLMAWLPTMIEHRCSVGERGGFFQRLREGTYPAHILEHVCIELQNLAGSTVGYGRARETAEEGVYRVVVRYRDERLARACLLAARELVLAAIHDSPYDVAQEVSKLRELADRVCLGPSTAAIVAAADARGIPVRRLNEGSLVQLGQGAKQRRIWTAETDRTSAVAESIAQDKELTKSLLRAGGIPVPEGRLVSDADDAWQAAEEIGVPVVVKPRDGNHARGVFTSLTSEAQVRAAFEIATHEGSGVIVEKFAEGAEHRLLVVGGKLVAATRGDIASIVGDGQRTVAQLVDDQINSDPRRGSYESCPLCRITLKDETTLMHLERQGHRPDSVPAAGESVVVQYSDNLSIDVTDQVHPSIAAHAALAAQIVGLDVAGLDVVASDISQRLEDQGGVVVEVNAGPGLAMHLAPSVGAPRPVGEAIVDTLFPPGENGRIPIVCVTGSNGKTTVTRLVAHILRSAGRTVGMTCSDGIDVSGRTIEGGDCAGPRSARKILVNPQVEAAVFEAARGGILREGLGFDRCDVAVVTNIGQADHLGLHNVNTVDDVFTVKRTPVDVVLPTGSAVLNASDPLVVKMAPLCAGSVIFFALDGTPPTLQEHRGQGKRAVFVRDGKLILGEGPSETDLISINEIPITYSGRAPFQVENALAAAAAAWALGLPNEAIRTGLETFRADRQDDPCRFNVVPYGEATLVIDDCHNVSALLAVVSALERFPHRRRTAVYSAGDQRRDEDIVRQGEILAGAFDRVILYDDPSAAGRAKGDVTGLLRKGLVLGERVAEIIHVSDYREAVGNAVDLLKPGELALVQVLDGEIESSLAVLSAVGVVSEEKKARGGAGAANKTRSRSVALPVTLRSSSRPDSKKN